MPNSTGQNRKGLSRRAWIRGLCLVAFEKFVVANAADDWSKDEESAVREAAAKAGITSLRSQRSNHYLAIGDSSVESLEEASRLVERLSLDYQKQLEMKGLTIEPPRQMMTLVLLGSRASYAKFCGEAIEETEGGHYDVETNRLVTFDFREEEAKGKVDPTASRYNTFTLVHEAIHQITYNGGIFSRSSDIPDVFSEGFATYGELWQLKAPKVGQVNRPRLEVLADPKRIDEWMPTRTLILDDDLFGGDFQQTAYAKAWLLIYHLLKTKKNAKALRSYLDRIRDRKDGSKRVEDAEACFGNLERLDIELSKSARLLISR